MKNIISILLGLIVMLNFNNCKNENVLEEIIEESKEELNPVIENKDKYELQILYTKILRSENGKIDFKTYSLQ